MGRAGGGVPEAHPRSRGENLFGGDLLIVCHGSSPLTRGKPERRLHRAERRRLIPAHAGKTESCAAHTDCCGAHPRSRGENPHVVLEPSLCHGSSPLTRGKHFSDRHFAARARLIPAHAGKTCSPPPPRRSTWAHPRSRGENLVPAGRMVIGGGSSPLTRGKLAHISKMRHHCRLIPAHAGKTAHQ